jgi:hypothetical protein
MRSTTPAQRKQEMSDKPMPAKEMSKQTKKEPGIAKKSSAWAHAKGGGG